MNDKLKGMSTEALKHANKRIHRYTPTCLCGESMPDISNTKHILCDECGRLYTSLSVGVVIMAHGAILETMRVVFNGNVTTKTFTWEM